MNIQELFSTKAKKKNITRNRRPFVEVMQQTLVTAGLMINNIHTKEIDQILTSMYPHIAPSNWAKRRAYAIEFIKFLKENNLEIVRSNDN